MDQSFSIVLPLRKKVRIAPGDLITELRLLVEETGATVRMDPRSLHQQPQRGGLLSSLRKAPPETVAFELDGVRLRVVMQAEPFANKLEIGRYVNPVMWDRGLGEFTDHRAYFRIYEAGIEGEEGPDATFDRAAAVTATASVVARLSDPVGAIWVAARNSVPMRRFGAALERLREGQAPLEFWLRWHVVPPGDMEDLQSGIVTGGLAAFTGREIMARPSVTPTRDMIDHAFELARRMVDERLAISDGQTVEGEGGVRLRVRLSGRPRKGEPPVCEIALASGAGAARRPAAAPPAGQSAAQPSAAQPGAAVGGAAPAPEHAAAPPRIQPGKIAETPPITDPLADIPPDHPLAGPSPYAGRDPLADPPPAAAPDEPQPAPRPTRAAGGGRRVIRLPRQPRGSG